MAIYHSVTNVNTRWHCHLWPFIAYFDTEFGNKLTNKKTFCNIMYIHLS